ncbi:hypothetical protein LZ632_23595 [Aeromonas salmonicida]|nr:hypothetical protein [Aeromonas salmonicida]MCE9936513.1 hypothetical protein [Aeromonas salmonicida]
MRIMPLLQAACLSLMLSACVAPLLMMSPTSQLMWALLKPLVGFDPNEANLFEQPIIKDRMTSILGPNYDSTMQLLKTANELQQEGPLFYVVSRYAPMPDVAKQAGMVWNSQTNQMSVMLLKADGTPQVFGENLAAATPSWPTEMQGWQAQAKPAATALSSANTALTDTNKVLTGATATTSVLGNVLGSIQQGASKTMADTTKQVVGSATASAQQQVNKAVADTTKQVVSSATATAQQQANKAVAEPTKQAVSSATASAQQQANKAVAESTKQAVSSSKATLDAAAQADAARRQSEQARAAAEAEMEALLK